MTTKMTKKLLAATTAFVLAATTVTAAAPSALAATFSDISASHWANTAIGRAADAGIMTGTGANKFSPSQTLTKAEFTIILSRAFYADDYAAAQNTAKNEYWYNEVPSWCAPARKVGGDHSLFWRTEMGNMDFTQKINRYDMAAMIHCLIDDKKVAKPSDAEISAAKGKIADWSSIPEDFRESVAICYAMGLLTGTGSSGAFSGSAYTDRASTAAVYGRLADKLGGGTYVPPKEETGMSEGTTTSNTPQIFMVEESSEWTKNWYNVLNSGNDPEWGYYLVHKDFQFTAEELKMMNLTNAERLKEGKVHEVKKSSRQAVYSERLTLAARIRAKEIAQSFSHTRPDGRNNDTTLLEVGYSNEGSMGEIIARGTSLKTPEDAIRGWISSKGHYAWLVGGDYAMGAAHYVDNGGVDYWVMTFYSKP